jgi:glyoxylase-like metal-dependent hydrolase (beta-lactamase superfamily II)
MRLAVRTSAFAIIVALGASLAACAPEATPVTEAQAPEAPAIAAFTAGPDVHAFTIGAFQAAALRDGAGQFPNDNTVVAINKTKTEVDAVLTANGLPTEMLDLSIQPMIVRTTDKVLLFDTGAAASFGPGAGKLPASLQAAGVDPASVTDIFISHAHGDHILGLVTAEGALAFPNAAVHIAAPQWAAMQADTAIAALVAAVTPKVVAFEPGADLVPGVKAIDIQGHTPGHSGYLITSGDASIAYLGDMAHHSVISVQRPDWRIQFDGDAPTAEASRKKFLEMWAASGQRIFAPHFPFPGVGKVEKQGDAIVWAAEK